MNESNVSPSNDSLVSTYCKYDESDTDLEKIAKHTAIVLLIVLGISLNIFIIILAAKFTVLKNLHHLIINMAISDALYLFVQFWGHLPSMSGFKWRIYPRGILGVILCKASTFLHNTSYMVSLISLLIISIERFKATRQRLQRSRQYTIKQRLLVIGLSWFISTPFTVIHAIKAEVYLEGKACFSFWAANDFFIIVLSQFSVMAILCCVIVCLSILTIRRLTRPQAIDNHLRQEQQNERTHRRRAAVLMVLASVLLYICVWLTYSVYVILSWVDYLIPSANMFPGCIDWRSLFFIFGIFLPALNSTFSPCIYIIFLLDFRKAAKKVFCRRNTVNQVPNNSFELQPIPTRRRRNCQEENIEL